MVLNNEELDVVLFIMCGCGLGDQYTSILTAYHMFNDLKKLGYNVGVAWNKNNLYFPSEKSLDLIFDLSGFETPIGEFIHHEISQKFNKFKKVEKFKVVELYTKIQDNFFETYNPPSYVRSHWMYNSNQLIQFQKQFVKKEILDYADNNFPKIDSVHAIHFRLPDSGMLLNMDEIRNLDVYGNEIPKLIEHISKNKNQMFMLASNNENFLNFFTKDYDNVFVNKFKHNLEKHNLNPTYSNKISTEILIEHTKEILSEMVMFAKCEKIYSMNTFPSNFVSYGIIHNNHYNPWYENLHNINLDINH